MSIDWSVSGAPTKFVTEPSASLKCPVCQNLFKNPVISTRCGHTFCEDCVSGSACEGSFESNCPLDQTSFGTSDVVANRAVQGQLEDLEIFCRHGLIRFDSDEDFLLDENGCKIRIKLGHREEHESSCEYALLPCPNSSNHCGKFRRRDLGEHLKSCPHTPCPFAARGCSFSGVHTDVEKHAQCCPKIKSVASDSENLHDTENSGNEANSKYLLTTLKNLNDRVADLEKDRELLTSQLKQSSGHVVSLKLQVEKLTQAVEQLRMAQVAMVRNRLGSQSTSDVATVYDNSNYKSYSSSSVFYGSSPTSSMMPWNAAKHENWKMPFTFKCIGTFRGHSGTIWALTTRGNHLFSSGADFTIKVWDVSDIKNSKGCIQTLKGHRDDVHALCTGSGCLYSAGSDMSIKVWNLADFNLQLAMERAHDNIICALLYTGKYIFSSSLASIKVWKIGTLEMVYSIKDLEHWVRALVCDKKREKIYSGSHNTVNIWDANNFALRGKVDHNHGSVYSLAVTNLHLIIGSYNRNTHLYDIDTFQPIKSLTGHLGTITGMAPSQSGNFLFTCSSDNTIQIWDINKLLPVQVLTRHEGSVNCIALRGNLLYSGSEDREIKVYCYFQLSENTFIR